MNVPHLSHVYVLFSDIDGDSPLVCLMCQNVLNYTAVCYRVSFEIIGYCSCWRCCCFSVSFVYVLRYLFGSLWSLLQ